MAKIPVSGDPLEASLQSTAEAYDELPYDDHAIYRSHPSRIAATAQLFGLQSADLAQARVLELGCAAGANIIPLAACYPNAQFLGIDLGGKQIIDGQNRIAAAGLANIELRQQSITELDEADGKFDFIISHGVYSWVPKTVQEAMLAICGRQLAPDGIAYVSYNVLPGWRRYQAMRDAFRLLLPKVSNAATRVSLARHLARYMGELSPDRGPYGINLRNAPDEFEGYSDAYIFHEYMEDTNEPCAFSDFVAAADRHGLCYLGESELSRMFAEGHGDDFAAKLDATTRGDIISHGQMLDILTGNTFRTSLLVKSDRFAVIDRTITPDRLTNLHYMASYQFAYERTGDSVRLVARDGSGSTHSEPTVVRLLDRLFGGIRRTFDFDSLIEGFDEDELPDLLQALLVMVLGDLVNIFAVPMTPCDVSEKPRASILARSDAEAGRQYTASCTHIPVEIDEVSSFLIRHLDGSLGKAALDRLLLDAVVGGQIKLPLHESTAVTPTELPGLVAEIVAKVLNELAHSGLLEA